METIKLKRIFVFNKTELSDIDANMSPKDIMDHYSNTYPELVNGTVGSGNIKGDKIIYEFTTNIGTKG